MKKRIGLVVLLVLALALLSCGWTGPLSLLSRGTPTPTPLPTPTPPTAPGWPSSPLDEGGEGGLSAEENLLTQLYERISPSVVHIQVTQKVTGAAPPMPGFPGIPNMPQMPDEFYQHGEGSGFVWDTEGHIVTNYHVVADASTVNVHFFDETAVEAEVIGVDPQSDIAILRVDPTATRLQPVVLGDSDTLKVGQLTIAIGNPFGQTWTMTRGIVSAVGRTLRPGSSPFAIPEMIQTDAAINPGNSGGPLLDRNGRVIGMNTMILSRSGASAGVGFAVPINIIKQVAPELIASGHYAYPWLGISGRDLMPEDVEAMDLPVRRGALVIKVVAGSPADKADLRGSDRTIEVDGEQVPTGGDVIVAVDDEPVRGMDDLIEYLVRSTRPDQEITLTVIRDGREASVSVILGERPASLNQ